MKKILLILLQLALILQIAGIGVFWKPEKARAVAVTRYVNSESDGSANNPMRAFDDPSYTANDSYTTISDAITAATADDTIEISGGASGESYAGTTISKTLTIIGTDIAGYDGTVTVNYDAGTGAAIKTGADNIILENLTFTGLNTGIVLYVVNNNLTAKKLILNDPVSSNFALRIVTTSGTNTETFENLIIEGSASTVSLTKGIYLQKSTADSLTANFNNCLINNSPNLTDYSNGVYIHDAGTTANFTNCIFHNNMYTFNFNGAGTINTTNSLIQADITAPHRFTTGTGTWNSTNDIINGFPYFTNTKADLGDIFFSVDDRTNIDYFQSIADYAMNTYDIPLTYYPNETYLLSSADKIKLQTFYKAGHEIGTHTRHHSNLALTDALKVTYSGANSEMTFTVSGSGTSLIVDGTSDHTDKHGPIDLTSGSYDTLGELCTIIGTWANFSCSLNSVSAGAVTSTVLSISLDDKNTALPISIQTLIPFDDDTGPNNRLYKEEITNSVTDLESALHEDPECSSYTVQTLSFPYNASGSAVLNWIKANATNLIGLRATSWAATATRLEQIDINNAYYSYSYTSIKTGNSGQNPSGHTPDCFNYSSLSNPEKQICVEEAARVMASHASNGYFIGALTHNATQLSLQEFQWLLAELMKYKMIYNININTLANLIYQIKTSGDWTDNNADGIWERTFSGASDLRLRHDSPLINAGTTVAGRTTDILGNPIVGEPDIGPYEFQTPLAPSSLNQYKSDGITTITTGNWINETSVELKFNMSSSNPVDQLTPKVEIQEEDTAFTDIATHTGTAVNFSGTPVTGTVQVTGLTPGKTYHWQASVHNASGVDSVWLAMGGNPDFGVDAIPPVLSISSPSNNLSTTDSSVTISGTAVDSESGVASVTVNGVPISNPSNFSTTANLNMGLNTFSIVATDNAGNSATQTLNISRNAVYLFNTNQTPYSVRNSYITISYLQNILKYLGYFPSYVRSTGYYGFITKKAVYLYQKAKGIVRSWYSWGAGWFGPKTRQVLNDDILSGRILPSAFTDLSSNIAFPYDLRQGHSGYHVMKLQQRLVDEGFLNSKYITGYFGVLTKQGVIKYQKAHGIDLLRGGAGRVGPRTRAVLNSD